MKGKRIIIILISLILTFSCFAQVNCGMDKNTQIAYLYDCIYGKQKLTNVYFFNANGNVLADISLDKEVRGFSVFTYDDKKYCQNIIHYDKNGVLNSSAKEESKGIAYSQFESTGEVCFCQQKSKWVSCKHDKYGNVTEAIFYFERTKEPKYHYKIKYVYNK